MGQLLNVPSFYSDLEYFIGIAKSNKFFIQRCLHIIYNLLEGEGSKCFSAHRKLALTQGV